MKYKEFEPSLKHAIEYCKRKIMKDVGYSFGEYIDDAAIQYYLRKDEIPYLIKYVKHWVLNTKQWIKCKIIMQAQEYLTEEEARAEREKIEELIYAGNGNGISTVE